MKAPVIIAVMAMTLMVSGIPMAEAAFFDAGQGWWMDESQWQKSTQGGNDIEQNGNNLEVIGTGVEGYAEYRSNWVLGMDENFAFSSGFFYNPPSEDSIMKLGLIPTGATNINGVSIGRGDEWDTYGTDRAALYWEVDLGSGLIQDSEWSSGGGTFLISYDSATEMITMSASDESATGSKTYDLSSMIVPGQTMSVYLGGGSRSDTGVPFSIAINPNQAVYFSNFQMINGTPENPQGVVPEPATLSLLGLGLLGFVFKKKKIA